MKSLFLFMSLSVLSDVIWLSPYGKEYFDTDRDHITGVFRGTEYTTHGDITYPLFFYWQPFFPDWEWEGDYYEIPPAAILAPIHEFDTIKDVNEWKQRLIKWIENAQSGDAFGDRMAIQCLMQNSRYEEHGLQADQGLYELCQKQITELINLKYIDPWTLPTGSPQAMKEARKSSVNFNAVRAIINMIELTENDRKFIYYADNNGPNFSFTIDPRLVAKTGFNFIPQFINYQKSLNGTNARDLTLGLTYNMTYEIFPDASADEIAREQVVKKLSRQWLETLYGEVESVAMVMAHRIARYTIYSGVKLNKTEQTIYFQIMAAQSRPDFNTAIFEELFDKTRREHDYGATNEEYFIELDHALREAKQYLPKEYKPVFAKYLDDFARRVSYDDADPWEVAYFQYLNSL